MSEQKEVKKNKKSTGKWTRVQVIGLWFMITASVFFWGGVYLGQAQMTETQNKIKAEAAALVELKENQ